MIMGKKVYLKAIEREDLNKLMDWRNNEEIRKYFREYREINIDMQNKWYEKKVLNDSNTIMFSIKNIENNELLGCCGLCYINWIHRHSDLSLYIGWENTYIDNAGFAKEACELILDYGFKEIGLNKIWTEIYEFDIKKKILYEDLNFKLDGVLRSHYYNDGKWWDSFILSILKDDYFTLGS